ncbi:MAG: hypothetical protein ABL966_04355 [Acidimicrobiales bacterium]
MERPAATSPAATPTPSSRSGSGCLVALLLFPVVVIAGLVIGNALSKDDAPEGERRVTLDEGTIGDAEWRVEAVRDVEGASCVFLYQDGEQLTGACSLDPQDATIDDETVVFGRADDGLGTVRVALDDGDVVEIDTVTADGIAGRFYVTVVAGDVDAEGFAP